MIGTDGGSSLAIAVEDVYGSVDPSNSALIAVGEPAWLQLYPDASTIADVIGSTSQPVYVPNRVAPGGSGAQMAEAETAYDGETPVERLSGDFTVSFDLRYMGANAMEATALGVILRSFLGHRPQTPGDYVTVDDPDSANSFFVAGGDIAKIGVGDVVAYDLAGVRRYTAITQSDGAGKLRCHPPVAFAGGEKLRLCHVFHPVSGYGVTAGASFKIRYEDRNRTVYLVGVRALKVALAFRGGGGGDKSPRTPYLSVTFRAADGYTDAAPARVATPRHWGVTGVQPAVWHLAPSTVSAPYEMTAPVPSVACDELNVLAGWKAEIGCDLNPHGDFSAKRTGHGDFDVEKPYCKLDLELAGGVDLRSWIRRGDNRTVIVSVGGPLVDGAGMAIIIPAVALTGDVAPKIADTATTESASFMDGRHYAGDSPGGDVSAHINKPFRLAVVA